MLPDADSDTTSIELQSSVVLVLVLVCSLPTVTPSAPNAFVGNNGQFDNEVDSPGSECSEDPQVRRLSLAKGVC